jgi:hypothetical protein
VIHEGLTRRSIGEVSREASSACRFADVAQPGQRERHARVCVVRVDRHCIGETARGHAIA